MIECFAKLFADRYDLGILWKDGEIINHRSALKVFCNPFLRVIGLCIGTIYNPQDKSLDGIGLMRVKRLALKFTWKVDWEHDKIEQKRILF